MGEGPKFPPLVVMDFRILNVDQQPGQPGPDEIKTVAWQCLLYHPVPSGVPRLGFKLNSKFYREKRKEKKEKKRKTISIRGFGESVSK